MSQDSNRGAASPEQAPAKMTPGARKIARRLARHSCRAFLKARRVYLRDEPAFNALDLEDASRDLVVDALVSTHDSARTACLASLLALMPGEVHCTKTRSTDRGNHAFIIDGKVILAVFDEDSGEPIPTIGERKPGQPSYTDGSYRVFTMDLENLIDLTPRRLSTPEARSSESDPSLAVAAEVYPPSLGGIAYRIEYAATAAAMLDNFAREAKVLPAETGGGYFGFTSLGAADSEPGRPLEEMRQELAAALKAKPPARPVAPLLRSPLLQSGRA